MAGLLTFGLALLFGVFITVSFKFITVLILIEVLNVLVLLFSFVFSLGVTQVGFLVFMVVATVEVTLSLVSLTRLWDFDSYLY